MILTPRCCPYCQSLFLPSPRRPDQAICSQTPCQNRRRNEYRRQKRRSDPEYAQVVRDSRRKWRQAHPEYQQTYRQNHPQSVAGNRQRQRQRDEKRRVAELVKNTLVFDLKRSAADVWVIGPLAADLEKNTLVASRLLILQPPGAAQALAAAS
jgi:hypothetical protein